MSTVEIQLNYLGYPMEPNDIDTLLDGSHPSKTILSPVLEAFFGLSLGSLPRDVVARYAELSTPEMYSPIFIRTDKIFERLYTPLKSAKRCYCFTEFLATIELSAHVAEMLATLVWQISPINFKKKPIGEDFEKKIFGSKFENLNQDKRIRILEGFDLITVDQKTLFDFLRTIRRKYFHLWSGDLQDIKRDASECFVKALQLVKEILKVEVDESNKIKMNPQLLRYIQTQTGS